MSESGSGRTIVALLSIALVCTPRQPCAQSSDTQVPSMESITVDDPRPLSAASDQFERRCHCIVTYDDPELRQDQVESLSGYPPGRGTPLVPKGRPFTFTVSPAASSQTAQEVSGTLQQMIEAFGRINGEGQFRLHSANGAFHVVPTAGDPLDAPITLERATRSLYQTISAIVGVVSTTSGTQVRLAAIPVNLSKGLITVEASGESGRDVLVRALRLSGRPLSWRLLYDFGEKAYYLNIHAVR